MPTRREFTRSLLGGGTALLTSSNLWPADKPAVQGSSQSCDLLVKGGTVIDPGQHLHAELDVAVKDGKILEVSRDFPESRAREVVSAKDKIVTPGLIDIHVHIYEGVGERGVNADHYCLSRGVTTAVDSGSAGATTIAGLRKYIISTSATRLYSSLDSSAIGAVTVIENLEWMDPQLAARAAEDNKPVVVGVTARVPRKDAGVNDLEILKRAREAAEATHLPMTVHIGDSYSPLKDILGIMRKGDVLAHCHNNNRHGVLDENGKILAEVWEARDRGILFSVAHDTRRFSFDVADTCVQQNLLPDAISSCIQADCVKGPVFDLPTTLSKFLLLGLGIDKVIELATLKPARIFNYGLELGTLRPGSPADIAIFELREGTFLFMDSSGEKRTGRQKLTNTATVCNGQLYMNGSEELA
jgi:dihydroorotase